MSSLTLRVQVERLAFAVPFRIAGYTFLYQDAVVVTLDAGGHLGRGEACGVYYLQDDVGHMVRAIEAQRSVIEAGIDRSALQQLLPPGGARNALDCALWELESHRSGRAVWELAGISPPKPLITTFTLGADTPAAMAQHALRYADAQALKLKLTGELALDIQRVNAVRDARPEIWLGVDANQGYARAQLEQLIGAMQRAAVRQIEQPLARGREAELEGVDSPIPLVADESALSRADLPGLLGRFDMVNIKLDKCGGLTEALAMAHEAHRLGLDLMVGNMMGSSWAMAPSFVVGQLCAVVDLDGPTFLREDRVPAVTYAHGTIWVEESVWGASRPDAAHGAGLRAR